MLEPELGQDLCGWRGEMLLRFQVWQDLVIDSAKGIKWFTIPCLLMRADPGNHRTFCLESRKSTPLVLTAFGKVPGSIRQGRWGNENLKKQDGAKLLNQEREQGCETWTFQRLQEPVVLGTTPGRVSTGQGPGYHRAQKTPGEIWFSHMRGFRELRPAEVSAVMGTAWGPRPRTGEGGVQDEPPVSLSDDLAPEDQILEEEPACWGGDTIRCPQITPTCGFEWTCPIITAEC